MSKEKQNKQFRRVLKAFRDGKTTLTDAVTLLNIAVIERKVKGNKAKNIDIVMVNEQFDKLSGISGLVKTFLASLKNQSRSKNITLRRVYNILSMLNKYSAEQVEKALTFFGINKLALSYYDEGTVYMLLKQLRKDGEISFKKEE